ncbi:glycoside hydrolase family 25 protein [Coprinopsis sp. MPI-PUGE-AT-0042]|nr:glycoside hydrolase family 25 protein [Coprinopsis sp. MPI-PUGE-AT-0042]
MADILRTLFILSCAMIALSSPLFNSTERAFPSGIDVSSWNTGISWSSVKSSGIAFAYIKATEGTNYKSPEFNRQYTGATNVGLIRGSYHYALPDKSSGAIQADYFVNNGGRWTGDGITLPGAVNLEWNPYGPTCYGLGHSEMVAWIREFSNAYYAWTKRYPIIYTTTNWWKTCTGNSASFSSTNPLWIAAWGSTVGALPAGWSFHTFWQYADQGTTPFNADRFNGDSVGLTRMARGS